jgi:hypothetical protein
MRITDLETPEDFRQQINAFARWAIKRLEIKSKPRIHISSDKDRVEQYRTFGSTKPTGEIWVYSGDRNTADVMRTLCHELVHYRQFETGSAQPEMDQEEHFRIEDEANAQAGRLMREYGKMHVDIYEGAKHEKIVSEGRTGSLQHEVADSLPQAFSIPALSSNNPYQQYKFGVAIASARGRQKRLDDGIGDFKTGDLDEVFADHEVVISFDPNIGKIIDDALKQIGVSGKKVRIGVEGSKESPDVQHQSPVSSFRGYPR